MTAPTDPSVLAVEPDFSGAVSAAEWATAAADYLSRAAMKAAAVGSRLARDMVHGDTDLILPGGDLDEAWKILMQATETLARARETMRTAPQTLRSEQAR